MMKAVALRDKTVAQLSEELHALRCERLKLRMQRSQGDEVPVHRFKEIRQTIARIMTVITEKERAQ